MEKLELIYEWNKDVFSLVLVEKVDDEEDIIYQEKIKNPAFYVGDKERRRGTLLDDLKIHMCRKMMLDDRNVEFMSIVGIGPADTEAWEKFYASAEEVLMCLLEGKEADIKLEGLIGSMTERFTQEDFSRILKPFYQETEKLLHKVVDTLREYEDALSKIILAGEYGTLAIVENWIKEYLGEEVYIEKRPVEKEDDGFVYLPKRG